MNYMSSSLSAVPIVDMHLARVLFNFLFLFFSSSENGFYSLSDHAICSEHKLGEKPPDQSYHWSH